MMTTTTEIFDAAYEYLRGKHCVLWADFDISQEDGLKRATDWLVEQIKGVARNG